MALSQVTMGGWEIATILVKALTYAASLAAAGGVLFLLIFREAGGRERVAVRRSTAALAVVAALATAACVPVQAGFLMGAGPAGMVEPFVLRMVLDSAVGTCAAVRLAGLALCLAVLLPGRVGLVLGAVGAVVTCGSFTLMGHTAEIGPRAVVAPLLVAHLLAASYWLGAFWPLLHVSRGDDPARAAGVLHRFGVVAVAVVGGLVLAGGAMAWLLTGGPERLWTLPYGGVLTLKLVVLVGLLALAAVNKWRLVPRFAEGDAGAGVALRRSIGLEIATAFVLLAVTGALTTAVSPTGAH